MHPLVSIRTRTRVSALVVSTFALAVAIVALPRIAAAQGAVEVYANDGFLYHCGDHDAIRGAAVSTTLSGCGGTTVYNGTATFSASASAIAGTLRASAATQFALAPSTPNATRGTAAESFGYAAWSDQGVVVANTSGPAAYRLLLGFGISGTTSAIGTPVPALSNYGYSGVAQFDARSTDMLSDTSLFARITSSSDGGHFYPPSVNATQVFSLLLHGGATNPFTYSVYVDGFAQNASYTDTMTGAVSADFSHTILPEWYKVIDVNGNDITSNYTVSFVNGMSFAPTAPVTTTPEPMTLAMLGSGLVGLIPAMRRKRR